MISWDWNHGSLVSEATTLRYNLYPYRSSFPWASCLKRFTISSYLVHFVKYLKIMRKKSAFWLFWIWTSKFHQNKSSLLSSWARWDWCTFFDLTTYYLGVIWSVNKLKLELQGLNGTKMSFLKGLFRLRYELQFFCFYWN